MSDLAETIRRVFQAPASHAVPMTLAPACPERVPPLAATVLQPFVPAAATVAGLELGLAAVPAAEPVGWEARVAGTPGLAAWDTGAKVCVPAMFQAERCARLAVPALPRRSAVRRMELPVFTTRSRSGWSGLGGASGLARPRVQGFAPALARPRAFAGLDRAMALPVAFRGEDLERVSRALWMRYTLQLVRATGENIRNLEVVGLYRIPTQGTRQVQHEPVTGRLLVALGPEAAAAPRAPFLLARRRSDGSIVCCFVEEA
jgi:hypothetical protein